VILAKQSRKSPLTELIGILRHNRGHRSLAARFAAAGIVLPVAAMLLYTLGLAPVQVLMAVLLAGWLCWSSGRMELHRNAGGEAVKRSSLLAVHTLDATLLLGAGLFCHLVWGLPAPVMALSAGAAMTNYLAYYSGAAFLKSVPAAVRTSSPRSMVELDHAFLANGGIWGAERGIVIGLTSLGLLAGRPETGLALAVAAGNIYWIFKSAEFWIKAGER
jgi:hypothetical protein